MTVGHDTPTPAIRFRDPDPPELAAGQLARAIAKTLVRAPTLPVPLPAYGLQLRDVAATRRTIDLILGLDAPIATLRLREARGEAAQVGRAVEVETIETNQAAARFADALATMAERIGRAVTPAQWADARGHADALARLPVGVPMEFHRQAVAGLHHLEGLVRVGFRCNQDCGMCWQGRDWGNFGPEQVTRWIEDLATAGAKSLIISGGEPTLDRALPDYIRYARSLGFLGVTIESNVIQCAKPGFAESLRDAGLTEAFVSLHSGDPAVSDAITRAPGTHERTVAGIRATLAAGIPVKLNAVMTQQGLDHLAELPDYIARTFAEHRERLRGIMFSYPTEPFERALMPSILPDPVALRGVLARTIERALALGLNPHGLDGPCGPALCAFGADPRVTALTPVPGPLDFRIHLDACERCAVRGACFGVRREDVALHGDAAVAPLERVPRRSHA